jgi:hypothetical protein
MLDCPTVAHVGSTRYELCWTLLAPGLSLNYAMSLTIQIGLSIVTDNERLQFRNTRSSIMFADHGMIRRP